ncbi:L-histidine N(alpha)-methyltransferase [Burkholderiaceae bacterium UC74_6]
MLDTTHPTHRLREAFRSDVITGLRRTPKQLPCRWLYDDTGSLLFEEITRLPEYYPTRVETHILRTHAANITRYMDEEAVLIEYGAGSAIKTEILLEALSRPAAYVPVDIASDFLALTARRLGQRYEGLALHPVVADFNEDFQLPPGLPAGRRRTAFFPGSTLGNLDQAHALALLRRMHAHVGEGGRAIISVDLLKDTATLLRAYDDAAGVTAAFNLNLLHRINRELDGDLPVHAFRHEACRNAQQRAVEMHLRCIRNVEAEVDGQAVRLQAGETIHTESSRKFDLPRMKGLVLRAGWRLDHVWLDELRRFAVMGMSPHHGVWSSDATWIDVETAFKGIHRAPSSTTDTLMACAADRPQNWRPRCPNSSPSATEISRATTARRSPSGMRLTSMTGSCKQREP